MPSLRSGSTLGRSCRGICWSTSLTLVESMLTLEADSAVLQDVHADSSVVVHLVSGVETDFNRDKLCYP